MSPSAQAVGALFVLAACAAPSPTTTIAIDGSSHAPLQVGPGRIHVLFFVSHECPIANQYAPTIAELAATWGTAVSTFIVHVGPDLTAHAAGEHAREYSLPAPILLDPQHPLAAALGITHTPEVAVLTPGGLAYRGRIDDRWGDLGARAQEPGSHDLRDAVAALRAGQAVANPRTPVVGCLLPVRP